MGRLCARHRAGLWLLEGAGVAGQSYPHLGPWKWPALQQIWTRGEGCEQESRVTKYWEVGQLPSPILIAHFLQSKRDREVA